MSIKTIACDGTDVFWIWILWLVIAFILGLILGWLLKQIFGGSPGTSGSSGKDDLTKIEGIGPKIEELLNNEGIKSYYTLSNTTTEKLHEIMVAAGPAYTTHKDIAYNWPAQALLADQGHWEALKRWQDVLKEGI